MKGIHWCSGSVVSGRLSENRERCPEIACYLLTKGTLMVYNLFQNMALKRVSTGVEHPREKASGGRLLWKTSGTCLRALHENAA